MDHRHAGERAGGAGGNALIGSGSSGQSRLSGDRDQRIELRLTALDTRQGGEGELDAGVLTGLEPGRQGGQSGGGHSITLGTT